MFQKEEAGFKYQPLSLYNSRIDYFTSPLEITILWISEVPS